MADKEPLWADIVAQHGLRPYRMADLTNWAYADRAMSATWDQMASMTKIRQAGWTESWDTEETITRQLERLRRQRVRRPRIVFQHSVSNRTGQGLAELPERLQALMEDQRLFPHVGMQVPLNRT